MGGIGRWNGPSGGGIGGNATANKIIAPYSAFVDGEEIFGILTDWGEIIFNPTSSDQSIPDGVYKDAVIKGAKIAAGNAAAAQVLTGYTFSNASGVNLAGSMVNRGALNIAPSTSAQTVQSGYYTGGTIQAISIATSGRTAKGSQALSLSGYDVVAFVTLGWKPRWVFIYTDSSNGSITTNLTSNFVLQYENWQSRVLISNITVELTTTGFNFRWPIYSDYKGNLSYCAIE